MCVGVKRFVGRGGEGGLMGPGQPTHPNHTTFSPVHMASRNRFWFNSASEIPRFEAHLGPSHTKCV